MSNVQDIKDWKKTAHEELGLKKGGGDGTFDGMEPRIAKLEAHAEHAQSDLADLKVSVKDIQITLARMEGILESKISYKWAFVYLAGIAALIMRSEIADFFK
ncbi:hypothetical protein JI58_07615 [Marinosulfonomonas sp. PRT-SC04]|nr:hypothetical protein JI58_07615 [Marinosulfonomonas sp. PRT-SC04]